MGKKIYNEHKYHIVLVSDSTATGNVYGEHILLKLGNEGSYTYQWKKIGTTATDLSAYSKKDILMDIVALQVQLLNKLQL